MDAGFPTRREQVASQVRREIFTGRLKAGQPVREIELAKRLGTGRGLIRDVFLQLTQEGLLVARANSGVRVSAGPDDETRPVLVAMRRQLETFALERAFDFLPGERLEGLERNLRYFQVACEDEALGDVVELDMQFHRLLLEAYPGISLVEVWVPIVSRIWLRYSRHRSLMEAWHEHAGIVTAIREGDRAEALRRLFHHIV